MAENDATTRECGSRRELPCAARWRNVIGMEPSIASSPSTMQLAVLESFSSFAMSHSACFEWISISRLEGILNFMFLLKISMNIKRILENCVKNPFNMPSRADC
eukprot:scaffold8944_cov82-Skeletonema_menzelii.AAC.2